MSRLGLGLGSSVVLLSLLVASACSHFADECENTSTCDPASGAASGGSSSGGQGGKSAGGNTSGGSVNAGESGSPTAGAIATGGGGAGTAGEGGGGGVMTLPCDGACATPTPVCDEPNDTCVECLQEADCLSGAKKKCDTTDKTCVDCLESADCSTAAAAKCDEGACVKCTSNDDCSHVAGKGVCDSGACVQCTAVDETACAGKSCNPATKACTNTVIGSVGSCKTCLADSECSGGGTADPTSRCVAMEYNGVARVGGYCLKRVSKICSRPFTVTFSSASLSGATSEAYCGIDQGGATCEAVLDMVASASCDDGLDTSCGCKRDVSGSCVEAGTGGLCKTVGGVPKTCSVACGSANECVTGKTCTVDDPYCH
jgi:hypothetical protein